MEAITAPDQRAVELQLAAAAGFWQALTDARQHHDALDVGGQVAVLSWIAGLTEQTPVTSRVLSPTREQVADEFAAAGRASLHPERPGYRYALGAYEALRWIVGARAEPLYPV